MKKEYGIGGFIIAVLVVLLYECKITKMRKEQRNKVRFYVTKNNRYFNYLQLWIGKPKWVENYDSWVSSSV